MIQETLGILKKGGHVVLALGRDTGKTGTRIYPISGSSVPNSVAAQVSPNAPRHAHMRRFPGGRVRRDPDRPDLALPRMTPVADADP